MTREEDLSKIDRSIRDAEIRISTVQTNLDALAKEIGNILALERVLKENVKCLKSQKIIAIAQEFKKAKEELKRTQVKLVSLRNDQEHFKKALNDMENFLKDARRDYNKLKSIDENNVLNFNFGKKEDGQG